MSQITLSTISGALATLFEDQLVEQWNRATVLSRLLPVKSSYAWNVNFDVKDVDGSVSPSSAAIADGADVSTYSDDSYAKATLSFTNYYDAFGISGPALNGAMATGNPAALVDLFGEKLQDAVYRLAKNLNSELYTGTGSSNRLIGLVDPTAGALKATGVYAGIDKSAVTLWAGNELLNGGAARPVSFQLMRATLSAIYTAAGEAPDCIVCDPTQWDRVADLFTDTRRYIQELSLPAGKIRLDGGTNALMFDGIPILKDKDCPSGKMLFLNTRHISLMQLADSLATSNPLPGGIGAGGMINVSGTPETQLGSGSGPFRARVIPLAVTGDSYKFELIVYPQLVVRRPNACAILGDLVEA